MAAAAVATGGVDVRRQSPCGGFSKLRLRTSGCDFLPAGGPLRATFSLLTLSNLDH
eukprot:CAMPEP_0118859372 /NCGR_PEP_ID=MMETSP1163-20130328/5648_1 /TAXON_ID=124430 /ORGANISM="Phaeomonas parva, Strain CCMP2877" /LENGTH=55 /DNA_ID=CAMNT_0006792949 /DNA_START=12 /DNA_END=182 /DNA_ORIENTATION=-